jgi:hypothetical protein
LRIACPHSAQIPAELRALVADAAGRLSDRYVGRHHAEFNAPLDRRAHYAPVCLAAGEKDRAHVRGPFDRVEIRQLGEHFVGARLGHTLLVRLGDLIGRQKPMLRRQDHDGRPRLGRVGAKGRIHDALVKIERGRRRRGLRCRARHKD